MPVPDSGAPERHRQQLGLGGEGASHGLLDLTCVAPELLAEPDRGRVLQVGATGLDDRPELVGLGRERGLQLDEGRQQRLFDGHRRGELQCRRDHVVGALAPIDVVVRVDLPPCAETPRREVRDDLVHVRVGRGSGTGLVDVDRELAVVVAIGDRGGRRRDGPRDVGLEQAQLAVRLGRRQLDQREGADEPAREWLPRDREVEHRALG